jgi:hypothetical protein
VQLEAVQRAYDAALARLMRDLRAETDRQTYVGVDFTNPDELPYVFRDDHGEHRTSLPLSDDEEVATLAVADHLQDDVVEMLWGQAWPRCGPHSHPAKPSAVHGRAVWACPDSGAVISAIGALAH